MNRRLTSLSINDKLNLINEYNEFKKKDELCKKYECDLSTVNRILKNEADLRSIAAQSNTNLQRKRMRKSCHDKVSRALSLWYETNRRRNTLITSAILLTKAEEFAVKFNEDFKPNAGWLWRWRRRENITFEKIHGTAKHAEVKQKTEHYVEPIEPDLQELLNIEGISNANDTGAFYKPRIKRNKSINIVKALAIKTESEGNEENVVDAETNIDDTEHYMASMLPYLLKNYKPEDIFNAGESCLLYRNLPNAKYADEVIKRNMEKARFTLLFICNATGSYRQLHAIGKLSLSDSWKRNMLPVKYLSDPTALMTSRQWANIIADLDEEMILQDRKIVLFVENVPCHTTLVDLKNINIHYLSANASSMVAPLNNGIITTFKKLYREILIKKQMCSFGRDETVKQFFKTITITNGLSYVRRAWQSLETKVIVQAFEKAGLIVAPEQEKCVLENVPDGAEYVKCDDGVECCLNNDPLSEDDIVDSIKQELSDDEDKVNNDKAASSAVMPTTKELFCAIDVLQRYCLHHNIDTTSLNLMEEDILKMFTKQLRPRQLEFYFKKPME